MSYQMLSLLIASLLLNQAHAGLPDDKLNYSAAIDLTAKANPYLGKTYFNLVHTTIKPTLDNFTMKGFKVKDGTAMDSALQSVGNKVSSGAISSAGSKAGLENIATELSKGAAVSFYDLPNTLHSTSGFTGSIFDATTYLALFSGGGVAVKYAPNTYSYNVNYGTGAAWAGEPARYATMAKDTKGRPASIHSKDPQTGRSYGAGPGARSIDHGSTGADDVSDKDYLLELASFVHSNNPSEFYRSLIMTIANSDTSNFAKMSDEAKTLAADFLAVYTAEEDRHLMNWPSHNWDSALLDVTLLSAFYANPSDAHANKPTWIMYTKDGKKTVFTQNVADQYADKTTNKYNVRSAQLFDYWQRSSQVQADPRTHQMVRSNRSGINITRSQFTALGREITAYERTQNAAVVTRVETALKLTGTNLFDELSKVLIDNQPVSIANSKEVADSFVAFLAQVTADAPSIVDSIRKNPAYSADGIDFSAPDAP